MATLKNVIKKAEKVSGQKIQVNENNEHYLTYKGYTISFYPNGRMEEGVSATCFYASKHIRTQEDHATDYFPGFFRDNINQLLPRLIT